MDANSLFLTANADTIYFLANVDLSKGPMVVETPPDTLGLFDDLWFRWVIDFGTPGPDRGLGGKYLLIHRQVMPDRCRTAAISSAGPTTTIEWRSWGALFSSNNNSKPAVETIKKTLKIYPYVPWPPTARAWGTFLTGKGPLAPLSKPGELTLHREHRARHEHDPAE